MVPVLITLIGGIFILAIVKMSLDYSERIEQIKHGYPLKDEVSSKKVDEEITEEQDLRFPN